jgi:hypothetical protein
MTGVGFRLIKIASIYMTTSLCIGLYMGMSNDRVLVSVHSHLGLLGWVTLALAGLIYLAIPACAGTRLSRLHFYGHNVGLPVMLLGLAAQDYGYRQAGPIVGVGSIVVLLSLLLFTINLLRAPAASSEGKRR